MSCIAREANLAWLVPFRRTLDAACRDAAFLRVLSRRIVIDDSSPEIAGRPAVQQFSTVELARQLVLGAMEHTLDCPERLFDIAANDSTYFATLCLHETINAYRAYRGDLSDEGLEQAWVSFEAFLEQQRVSRPSLRHSMSLQ